MSTQIGSSSPGPKGEGAPSHDPRDRLVREKYFSLRPKPLERYLWQQGLPQAAERVFWLHWEEGMRNRDWCSEVPLKRVATLCCIDTSTVTRAYQVLKSLGLIRRESAGRDPENPFQQATAITEVRIPRELLTELARSPNRSNANALRAHQGGEGVMSAPAEPEVTLTAPRASESPTAAVKGGAVEVLPAQSPAKCPSRQEVQAMWGRASATERSRFFTASRDGTTGLAFDANTKLTPEDRGQLLAQLEQMARARHATPKPLRNPAAAPTSAYAKPRRLSVLELARTRKRIAESVPNHEAPEVLRQVVWAAEEGALRQFELPLAVNIALKKIREGAWTRPNRMPPNWARFSACAETCSAA